MGKDRVVAPSTQAKLDRYAKTPSPITANASGSDKLEPPSHTNENQILQAIGDLRSSVEGKIEELRIDLSLIRQDLRKTLEQVTEAEGRISDIEDTQKTTNSDVLELLHTVKNLELKAEDAEGRSRRNNLQIVGIPEGTEGTNPTSYISDWIRSWVPSDVLSNCFVLERVHRALVARPPPGAPPRPFIARLLNYADRDAVLRAARSKENVECGGNRVLLFPDYTMRVQQQRRSFLAVKQKLRAMQISYMLLFPAKLKVLFNGKTLFFETPESAWDWVKERPNLVDRAEPAGHMSTDTKRQQHKWQSKTQRPTRQNRRHKSMEARRTHQVHGAEEHNTASEPEEMNSITTKTCIT